MNGSGNQMMFRCRTTPGFWRGRKTCWTLLTHARVNPSMAMPREELRLDRPWCEKRSLPIWLYPKICSWSFSAENRLWRFWCRSRFSRPNRRFSTWDSSSFLKPEICCFIKNLAFNLLSYILNEQQISGLTSCRYFCLFLPCWPLKNELFTEGSTYKTFSPI